MNARELEAALVDILQSDDAEYDDDGLRSVESFDDAGLLTKNRGVVLRFNGGDEFQLTIVQSYRAKEAEDNEDDEA